MTNHKYTNIVCSIIVVFSLIVAVVFMNGEKWGLERSSSSLPYVDKLFSADVVHTIDIIADEGDWQELLDTAINEEYINCNVVIDGNAVKDVGIRAKGNTSLSTVASSDSDRYSFKIEFDHYESGKSYYGLDKLALNNIIQDNTYLKDFLCYNMMNAAGAEAPLCSFAYITVNGEDWGLYAAVEGVEEAFAQRNYGSDYGTIYKPDGMEMGGGKDHGENQGQGEAPGQPPEQMQPPEENQQGNSEQVQLPEEGQQGNPEQIQEPQQGNEPGQQAGHERQGRGGMGGSNDTSLIYTDDEYDSYENIFNSAVFTISDADKDRLIQSLKKLNEGEDLSEALDIDEVISYFVAHNFVLNGDSYTGNMIHNYYLHEKDGQMSMIAWDYNLAFGAFAMGSSNDAATLVNYPLDDPLLSGSMDTKPMIAWIFENEEYLQQYHQAVAQFLSEYFESGAFERLFDQMVELISPYVEKDPTKFCTYEEFLTGTETLKEFCLLRAESLQKQLDGIIPSTSEGQKEDASSLVDASNLSINAMGSMGMGGGMGGERNHGGFPGRNSRMNGQAVGQTGNTGSEDQTAPEEQQADLNGSGQAQAGFAENEGELVPGSSAMSEGTGPGFPGNRPDQAGQQTAGQTDHQNRPGGGMQIPGETGGNQQKEVSASQWIWLGGSAAALLLGILLAVKYKR